MMLEFVLKTGSGSFSYYWIQGYIYRAWAWTNIVPFFLKWCIEIAKEPIMFKKKQGANMIERWGNIVAHFFKCLH
jgi:hypothetical protein